MGGWMNGVCEAHPASAELDQRVREDRQAAALRYLEGLPGDNTDVMMMLGLIESPPAGDARRAASRERARQQRRRARVAKQRPAEVA